MSAQSYDKIEYRVNVAVPEWKEWPRRLRRIYASLEDWGSSDAAVEDMVKQWGWSVDEIQELIRKTPTWSAAIDAYRAEGDYPYGRKSWVKRLTASQIKTVYMREGELTSYASLDENPKATAFHSNVVESNGMMDMNERYIDRDDIGNPDGVTESEGPQRATDSSGLGTWREDA